MINLKNVKEFNLTTIAQGLSSNHFYKLASILDDAIVIQKKIWGYAGKEHYVIDTKILHTVMPLDQKYRTSLTAYSEANLYYYSLAGTILNQI
jgi:hypothetical protein